MLVRVLTHAGEGVDEGMRVLTCVEGGEGGDVTILPAD